MRGKHLSIHLSICLSICPSIYLSVYLSVCPSIYLSSYPSFYLLGRDLRSADWRRREGERLAGESSERRSEAGEAGTPGRGKGSEI